MSWESKARYLEELRTKGNNDYDKVVEEIENRIVEELCQENGWNFPSGNADCGDYDIAVREVKWFLARKINDLSLSDLIKKYLAGELVERDILISWMYQEASRHKGTVLGDAFERVVLHYMAHKDIRNDVEVDNVKKNKKGG